MSYYAVRNAHKIWDGAHELDAEDEWIFEWCTLSTGLKKCLPINYDHDEREKKLIVIPVV